VHLCGQDEKNHNGKKGESPPEYRLEESTLFVVSLITSAKFSLLEFYLNKYKSIIVSPIVIIPRPRFAYHHTIHYMHVLASTTISTPYI